MSISHCFRFCQDIESTTRSSFDPDFEDVQHKQLMSVSSSPNFPRYRYLSKVSGLGFFEDTNHLGLGMFYGMF